MRIKLVLRRASFSKRVLAVFAVLAIAGCEATPLHPVNPESAKIASDIPVADLHLHPNPNLIPTQALERMDRNGVRWAGAGTWGEGAGDKRKAFSRDLGDRFINFIGQAELSAVYRAGGVPAMEDASHPGVQDLRREAEEELKAGRIKGIGEIFVNNIRSSRDPTFRRKARTDAPSIRLLYKLVAKYDAFLTIHMEAHSDSVSQLEALLESDRRGRILWNHCGVDSGASDIRPLLRRHPNLFCELSFRYPPVVSPRLSHRNVFDRSGPLPAWLKLIEEFPDRFMIGTDAHDESEYDGAIAMVRRGLLPYLRPATARMVAHENAQRLFGLR